MRTGILAWLGGVVLLQQLAQLPSPWLLCVLPLAVVGIWRAALMPYRLLAWAMAGFLWSLGYAHLTVSPPLAASLTGRNIIVEGDVASLAETYPEVTRFEFDVTRIVSPEAAKLPRQLRVSWRNMPEIKLRPGDRWRLTLRLKSPRGFYNPGSFDYEVWLLQQGIGATGYVRSRDGATQLGSNRWAYPVQSVRATIRERLEAAVAGQPNGRVAVALVLGVQTALTDADWAILRNTGTSHLLAISGLHISLIAGLIYWLMGWLWRRSARLTHWLAAPRAAAVTALVAAAGYSALAGFSIPTQRSCVMLVVVFGAILLNYRVKPSYLLALALWLILLFDPLAVMAMGFWLSFGAVAIILFLSTGRRQAQQSAWRETVRMQFAICLGLIPLLIVLFEQVPVYSPLVNLVAVPFVTFVIVPVLLSGTFLMLFVPMLGNTLLSTGVWLIDGLWWALDWAASWPYATVNIPAVSWLALLVAMAGMVLLGLPAGLPRRWLALLTLVPLILPSTSRPGWGEVYFTLLDVGQGLAAAVQTHHHLLIFDTGPKFSERFDTGEAVILPFMRHNGYDTIDHLIISHGDNDHIGGMQGLVGRVKVTQVSSSVPEKILALPVSRCIQGQHWEWEGVDFTVLHPPESAYAAGGKENNLSCVLRVTAGNQHVLLTGDIESRAEQALIHNNFTQLSSQILVAPHHGSLTSSSAAFIRAVNPDYVLFATGQNNRHRFPSAAVVSRYRAAGVSHYDTASAGAIRFWLRAGKRLEPPQLHRLEMRRYWQQP